MSIRFSCAKCGTAFNIAESAAGKSTTCPNCQAPIRVPPVGVALPAAASAQSSRPVPRVEPLEPERDESDRWEQYTGEDEDDRRDDPPPRRHESAPRDRMRPRRTSWGYGLRTFSAIVWALVLVATAFVGFDWLSMMKHANSAIQESSGSAMTAAVLIGMYVAARAIEKVCEAIDPR